MRVITFVMFVISLVMMVKIFHFVDLFSHSIKHRDRTAVICAINEEVEERSKRTRILALYLEAKPAEF